LEVQREGNPQTVKQDVVLMVRSFSLSPGYHAKELTYRTGSSQYESDYYNQFIIDVGRQIGEQTRLWLAQSGIFTHVVPPGSTMSATHLLEGNITQLYGDFRDKINAQAVMSITFYFLDISSRKPIIKSSETFNVTTPVADNKVENLIDAYNQGLQMILSKYEEKILKINLSNKEQ
jgi:cholesterol transport system auxiliary component